MNGGISESRWRVVIETLRDLGAAGDILLFGSRAKGGWREGSDIDLAITDADKDFRWAAAAKDALEERCFPYSFDVLLIPLISEAAVLDHIRRVGKKIA